MKLWFNKTFSTISSVIYQLRQALPVNELTIVATHIHSSAVVFLAADECYLEPESLAGEQYLHWCVQFCLDQHITAFWPGKEAALISEHHALFQAIGVKLFLVADSDTLKLLHDKAEFYRRLPAHIAKIMEVYAVNDSEQFNKACELLYTKHAVLCVKPAVSVFGLGFRILDTQETSVTHIVKGTEYRLPLQELQLGLVNTPTFATLLVMEYLPGPEWSVDCVGQSGRLLCAVQRKKSPQPGYGQQIDNNDEINTMVSQLTAHYRLNGLFNIQFKASAEGPRCLEINPRPSGGVGMACLAGVNLPYLAWQAGQGEIVDIPAIQYGLKVTEEKRAVMLPD
ncbi:MAG: ATP-grasp domain-containing protein [Methylovulum sp.]|nr:ATP-grasp domain-containing protein [Methylovulum sp.]